MNHQQCKQLIEKVLQQDQRLWTKTGELDQTLLLELLEQNDAAVIAMLVREKTLKDRFFVKALAKSAQEKEIYVFKMNDFRFFMEEHKTENSYTQYKNRIGLASGKRFLKDSNDVVLDFPFKDCVLEGGQSNEEGHDVYFEYDETVTVAQEKQGLQAQNYNQKQTKRKEIFFNTILAQDEIDRLFDEKALVNWTRYASPKIQHEKIGGGGVTSHLTLKRDASGTIKDNLIIKGNNLLVLHSLKQQFAGKIKLIYIDPPYNTGNDGFKYNDNFNHSTWLTFMKNRLEVAKTLLRDDGVIFVQCDDNEQAYLKVLMDEVFGKEKFRETIILKSSTESGVNAINVKRGERLFKVKEYILFYSKNKSFKFNPFYTKTDFNVNYKYEVIKKANKYVITNLYEKFKDDFKNLQISSTEKGLLVKNRFIKYALSNANNIYSLEKNIKKSGEKFKDFARNNIKKGGVGEYIDSKNELKLVYEGGVFVPLRERVIEDEKGNSFGLLASDLWLDISTTPSSEGGIKFNNGKKSEKLLERIIKMVTKENDIVLDYHLGSGTTAAVAHKMGRQYIGIEQMDYIEDIAVERLKKVIDGEQGGISKSVGWQGGGDFLYCELAQWNEKAKAKILQQNDFASLKSFFQEMYENYFLNYNLKTKEFVEKVIEEEHFAQLTLDEQKAIFVAMLDNNQMYVNKSEMADNKYGISKKDQELTAQFYNEEE